jgi:hypothetical protein
MKTRISEANRKLLEDKYRGRHWSITPENRAFVGARQQCESPRHPYYRNTGALGICFLYNNLDEFLADVGFRPTSNHCLERIDRSKPYEKGNVKWSLRAFVSQKSRPIAQAERTIQTMMVRILKVLGRQPDKEMKRAKLQHCSGSNNWGANVFHEAVRELAKLGFVEYFTREHQFTELDGHNPGQTRLVTRSSDFVKLLDQKKGGSNEPINESTESEPAVAV